MGPMVKVTYSPRKFNLRMSEELRAELQAQADRNGRSLNAEIVQRLLSSVRAYRA